MAILFQCPECQAEIKVPDSAAGRKGTCPGCKIKLIVPEVMPPPAAAAPAAATQPQPVPAQPEAPPLEAFQFDAPVLPGATKSRTPSVSAQLKRRQRAKKKGGGLLVPLLCGAVVVGFCGWMYFDSQPKLEGTLLASPLIETELPPALIPTKEIDVNNKIRKEVLDDLREHPARLNSTLVEMTFRGATAGLEVEVLEGPQTQFYRVDPTRDAALLSYIQTEAPKLDPSRLSVLQAGLKQFFKAWERQLNHQETIVDHVTYRNSVGLTALVGGFGYHVEAVVGLERYRCVFEDGEGRLYFLLPQNTQTFVLEGTEHDGQVRFPGRYEVEVTAPQKGPKPRIVSEPEAEYPLGMNPDLYKDKDDSDSGMKPEKMMSP